MGLDACVYCDCLEKKRLRKPLPGDVTLKIEADGYPSLERNGATIWEEDGPDWNDFACEHERRQLIHHRLGNIALVALLRWELKREVSLYPILLGKVVYNGIHAGDYLGLEQFSQLQVELQRLATFRCVGDAPQSFSISRFLPNFFPFTLWKQHYSTAAESNRFMQNFRNQMLELVDAASRIGKPISF